MTVHSQWCLSSYSLSSWNICLLDTIHLTISLGFIFYYAFRLLHHISDLHQYQADESRQYYWMFMVGCFLMLFLSVSFRIRDRMSLSMLLSSVFEAVKWLLTIAIIHRESSQLLIWPSKAVMICILSDFIFIMAAFSFYVSEDSNFDKAESILSLAVLCFLLVIALVKYIFGRPKSSDSFGDIRDVKKGGSLSLQNLMVLFPLFGSDSDPHDVDFMRSSIGNSSSRYNSVDSVSSSRWSLSDYFFRKSSFFSFSSQPLSDDAELGDPLLEDLSNLESSYKLNSRVAPTATSKGNAEESFVADPLIPSALDIHLQGPSSLSTLSSEGMKSNFPRSRNALENKGSSLASVAAASTSQNSGSSSSGALQRALQQQRNRLEASSPGLSPRGTISSTQLNGSSSLVSANNFRDYSTRPGKDNVAYANGMGSIASGNGSNTSNNPSVSTSSEGSFQISVHRWGMKRTTMPAPSSFETTTGSCSSDSGENAVDGVDSQKPKRKLTFKEDVEEIISTQQVDVDSSEEDNFSNNDADGSSSSSTNDTTNAFLTATSNNREDNEDFFFDRVNLTDGENTIRSPRELLKRPGTRTISRDWNSSAFSSPASLFNLNSTSSITSGSSSSSWHFSESGDQNNNIHGKADFSANHSLSGLSGTSHHNLDVPTNANASQRSEIEFEIRIQPMNNLAALSSTAPSFAACANGDWGATSSSYPHGHRRGARDSSSHRSWVVWRTAADVLTLHTSLVSVLGDLAPRRPRLRSALSQSLSLSNHEIGDDMRSISAYLNALIRDKEFRRQEMVLRFLEFPENVVQLWTTMGSGLVPISGTSSVMSSLLNSSSTLTMENSSNSNTSDIHVEGQQESEKWRKLFLHLRRKLKPHEIPVRCRLFEGVISGAEVAAWLIHRPMQMGESRQLNSNNNNNGTNNDSMLEVADQLARDRLEACSIGQQLLQCGLLVAVCSGYEEDDQIMVNTDVVGTGTSPNQSVPSNTAVADVLVPSSTTTFKSPPPFSDLYGYIYRFREKSATGMAVGCCCLFGTVVDIRVLEWSHTEDEEDYLTNPINSSSNAATNTTRDSLTMMRPTEVINISKDVKGHIEYLVDIKHGENENWQIWRRFREFQKLSKALLKEGIKPDVALPSKTFTKAFGLQISHSTLDGRKQGLETFLRSAIEAVIKSHNLAAMETLAQFLDDDHKKLRIY